MLFIVFEIAESKSGNLNQTLLINKKLAYLKYITQI